MVAIGLASGLAAVLPGALVDSGLPLWAMWTLVGGLAVVSALAMLAAEWISPIYQANQAQPMH
ncbi:hypothetical protein GCM10025863_21350 [Microbacterium suwonense]|uniref:Uncharacterized protein n=1 Tax=Microbacterium suwonense TaxID=683047 RepID=A0ABN6X465_9MICO|nr:hypothetical protein GCM10025863_21350 [Microbacterium suwonense]